MNKNKGSAVVYIVLLIFVLMTSSAIVLSVILNRHIKSSENYLISEQAFAAANSGVEQMLYKISKQAKRSCADVGVSGSITYNSGSVVNYVGKGSAEEDAGVVTSHLEASGAYKGAVRRIEYGGGSDDC